MDDLDIGLIADTGLAQNKLDPLGAFRCSSDGQGHFIRHLRDAECYARTGNQSGKTYVGAAVTVSLMRGLPKLDGIDLPVLNSPAVGALLVKSKQQGVESAVKALKEVIGDHDHHIAYSNAGLGYVGAIYVRPDHSRSKDHKAWSRLIVLSEDSELPVGLRLDFAWADEPPAQVVWRELRKRGRANRPFIRYITATPLKRADWEWLRADFEGAQGVVKGGRIEIRWSVYENRALGPEHIRRLEELLEGDPTKDAALRGDYVDTSGLCPFDLKGLQAWESRCRKPARTEIVDGARAGEYLEIWAEPERGHEYVVTMDPSAGHGSGDRCGLWVVDKHTRMGVARFFGYLTAYNLGVLGRKMCERYNEALAVPEMNGGYGEALVIGLDGYRKIYFGEHLDRVNGTRLNRLGWYTTMTSKGTLVAAMQRAVLADDFTVPSQHAVSSLMAMVMDEDQKLVRPAGQNHEDFICLALGMHLCEQIPVRPEKKEPVWGQATMGDMIRMSMGLPKMRRTNGSMSDMMWRK